MEVLITSQEEKLPEDVRVLFDESRPLSPGVAFFEERFSVGTLLNRLALGSVLLVGGLLVAALGVWMLVDDFRQTNLNLRRTTDADWWVIGFGAVLGLAGWLFLGSLRDAWVLKRRQSAGAHTRFGLYLLPHALVNRSSFDTTVIPRECFRGFATGSVRYEHAGQVKTFALPGELIDTVPAQRDAAILAWSQLPPFPPDVHPPPLPGPASAGAGI